MLLAGLAFKAGTGCLRESPNIDLARSLLRERYRLSIFDPAIDAGKLVGANLGYAWSWLPQFATLLVSKKQAEGRRYDRVIFANRTAGMLSFSKAQSVIDLNALSDCANRLPAPPASLEEPARSGDAALSFDVRRAVA